MDVTTVNDAVDRAVAELTQTVMNRVNSLTLSSCVNVSELNINAAAAVNGDDDYGTADSSSSSSQRSESPANVTENDSGTESCEDEQSFLLLSPSAISLTTASPHPHLPEQSTTSTTPTPIMTPLQQQPPLSINHTTPLLPVPPTTPATFSEMDIIREAESRGFQNNGLRGETDSKVNRKRHRVGDAIELGSFAFPENPMMQLDHLVSKKVARRSPAPFLNLKKPAAASSIYDNRLIHLIDNQKNATKMSLLHATELPQLSQSSQDQQHGENDAAVLPFELPPSLLVSTYRPSSAPESSPQPNLSLTGFRPLRRRQLSCLRMRRSGNRSSVPSLLVERNNKKYNRDLMSLSNDDTQGSGSGLFSQVFSDIEDKFFTTNSVQDGIEKENNYH